MKKLSLLFILLLFSVHLFAQKDSVVVLQSKDSITVLKNIKPQENIDSVFTFRTAKPLPKRAAFYSAALPGLGQWYNHQIYKVPVLYAGFGAATYLFIKNYTKYKLYQKAYVYRTDNNILTVDTFKNYTAVDLRTFELKYRRNLDKIVVYSIAWYGVNILDALVAAHLRDFDVSKNISFKAVPYIDEKYVGLNIKMNF